MYEVHQGQSSLRLLPDIQRTLSESRQDRRRFGRDDGPSPLILISGRALPVVVGDVFFVAVVVADQHHAAFGQQPVLLVQLHLEIHKDQQG